MDGLNFYLLLIFAPVLILTGLLGFVVPHDKSFTSGAPAYNVFHIVFGLVGLAAVLGGNEYSARAFNIGFGLIDLYQLAASQLHWFPEKRFRWTRVDDILHFTVGATLVAAGVFAG